MSEGTPFILGHTLREGQFGSWKDGLFDCCRNGLCHPSLVCAFFCPQILMAQVLTRLKMNWLGDRAPEHEWKSTFRTMLWILGAYWILTMLLSPSKSAEASFLQSVLYRLLGWALTIYTLVVLTKVRRQVRLLFDIPIQSRLLGQGEDVCLSFWCGCCVVSQLARQTCDYDEEKAAWWSSTGLQSSSLGPTSVLTV